MTTGIAKPEQFYDTIFAAGADGYVAISTLDQARVGQPQSWSDTVAAVPISAGGLEIARTVAEVNAAVDSLNVYFTPAPRREPKRGHAGNTRMLTCLWAEYDAVTSSPGKLASSSFESIGEVNAMLWGTGIPEPSAMINSGNGWHVYWALEEPLEWPGPAGPAGGDGDIARDLLARWGNYLIDLAARRGKFIDKVFDAARVLRAPGTYNRKHHPPAEVTIVSLSRRVHSYGDLDDLLPPLSEYTKSLWSETYDTSDIRVADLTSWLDSNSKDPSSPEGRKRIAEAVKMLRGTNPGGRHDGLLSALAAVVQEPMGKVRINVADALGELKAVFDEIKPDQADKEFENVVKYVVGQRIKEADRKARSVLTAEELRPFAPAPRRAGGGPQGTTHHRPGEVPAHEPEATEKKRRGIDWSQPPDQGIEFLVPGLVPRGRLTTFQSRAAAGKSFIVLSMAAGLATGGTVLGFGHPSGQPIRVLYLDWEMTPQDVFDRLQDLKYDPELVDMSHLVYESQPDFFLNDPAGARELLEWVRDDQIEVVVVDTMSRAIDAAENDAEGWREAMRYAWTPLKAMGVTVIRLDHLGKDVTRGGRGSSSKRDEADVIWNLKSSESVPKVTNFKIDKARIALPSYEMTLHWEADPDWGTMDLRMEQGSVSVAGAVNPRVDRLVRLLDQYGVPLDMSRRKAREFLTDAVPGFGARNNDLGEALKQRQQKAAASGMAAGMRATQVAGTAPSGGPKTRAENPSEVIANDSQKVVPGVGDHSEEGGVVPGVGDHLGTTLEETEKAQSDQAESLVPDVRGPAGTSGDEWTGPQPRPPLGGRWGPLADSDPEKGVEEGVERGEGEAGEGAASPPKPRRHLYPVGVGDDQDEDDVGDDMDTRVAGGATSNRGALSAEISEISAAMICPSCGAKEMYAMPTGAYYLCRACRFVISPEVYKERMEG